MTLKSYDLKVCSSHKLLKHYANTTSTLTYLDDKLEFDELPEFAPNS